MVSGQPDSPRARACRSHRLQVLRRDREHGGHPLNGHAAGARRRLADLRQAWLPDDLRAWAGELASPSGALPLLGADSRADTYPALLWNGARLHRAGAATVDALTLVAVAAMSDATTDDDLERGVLAGLRVASAIAAAGDTLRKGVGRPTLDVLPAAACAFVVGGGDVTGMARVLDLAGTLMVVGPPSGVPDTAADADLRAGHCLAAGWLAPRLLYAGLAAVEGALDSTLASVRGREPAGLMAGLM